MLRQLNAWWKLTELGAARSVTGQIEQFFRFYIIMALHKEGFFDYLKEHRTYGELLANFSYTDDDYTRELLELMATEPRNLIIRENNHYELNLKRPIPTLEALLQETEERYHNFAILAEDLAQYVPYRLRAAPVEFSNSFEENGREMMQKFDEVLANQLYTVSRKVAFAMLTKDDKKLLDGATLLDVGCGSGREPAELWLEFNGTVKITGIDTILDLVQQARQSFPALVQKIDPDHPPIKNEYYPVFEEASVTHLPFDDNSFDAVFHSHILHWTSDPRVAIAEVARVLRPDGLVFGVQTCKPYTSMYTDILWRSNVNCFGYFWREEFRRWYLEHGFELEIATPAGAFRGRKANN